jgi:type I restriction enzyme S subunit
MLDGRFLAQLLQLHHIRQYFATLANGITRFGLGTAAINEANITLPNVAIQQKIADILTTWDEALEKLDALIAAKDRRKQALMQQLLIGKIRFPAFASASWKKVRMSEVLTRVFRPIEWTEDLPLSLVSLRRRCGGLFRRPDVLGADYKTQDLHELKRYDFLVSKRQVVHGAWALVKPDFEGSHVSKEYVIFVSAAPDKLHMPFFSWLAQTPRLIRLARVASTGVHIEKLIFDPDVFLRESIRIPATVTEQKQIAVTLDATQSELRFLYAQRAALDQQKRGLMRRLLTGAIRVRMEKT